MYLSCPAMTSFPYLWGKLSNFCIFVQRIKLLLLVFEIVKTYLPEVHCYGDDTQAYISFSSNLKSDPFLAIKSTENCILDIRLWILNDCLNWMMTKPNFLLLAHHNSWERLTSRVSAWVTLTLNPFPLQGTCVMFVWHQQPLCRNLGKACKQNGHVSFVEFGEQ